MTSRIEREKARARRALGLALLAALAGCGRAPAPERIALARGFVPGSADELDAAWGRLPEPIGVRAEPGGEGVWLEVELAPERWRVEEPHADAPTGVTAHWTERPLVRPLQSRGKEGLALVLDDVAVSNVPNRAQAVERARAGERAFFLEGPRLVVLAADSRAPGAGRFATRMERGRSVDGTWRATLQELVADGLAVWPGERHVRELELAPESVLRFGTAARSLGRPGRVTFRILRDGAPLFEHAMTLADSGLGAWHELALGAPGHARLELEVRGDPGLSAFLHPWIGPRALGEPGARPWADERPDVVLFLADTFRADLLAASGGPPDVAPRLSRSAARGLDFVRARAPGTWTLPSQASLFTGLFPTQHGALRDGLSFASELVTIAEHLAAAGYRTAAVTDAGFVSRQYGFDQGFELFLERPRAAEQRLANTLADARALLARDDGRPLFLFVHSYRTHWPYRTGPEEDRREHDALVARHAPALTGGGPPDPTVLRAFADGLLALYHRAARELDEAVGAWIEELERDGFLERGVLVFTSDHGEAFFEHGKAEHTGPAYEEELRIPLFLLGHGIPARRSRAPATLLDLAPTLAELCALAPDPRWPGRSLLSAKPATRVFAWFEKKDGPTLSVIDAAAGERKLFVPARPEALARDEAQAAFDLTTDPGETRNLVREGAAWPSELARASHADFERLARLQAEVERLEVGEWLQEELEKLGYGGR
jgi:arylsulfatase A-like enzyme